MDNRIHAKRKVYNSLIINLLSAYAIFGTCIAIVGGSHDEKWLAFREGKFMKQRVKGEL